MIKPEATATPYPEYQPDPISKLDCIKQANLAKGVGLLKEDGMREDYMLGMVHPGLASQMVAAIYDCKMSADEIWARAVHLCEEGEVGRPTNISNFSVINYGADATGVEITSAAPGQCTW